MKLRQIPEDFVVEEISTIKPQTTTGKFKLYLLQKKGLETFYLIDYLSKKNNIPANEFGIAGLKDKYAFTKQYMTLPAQYEIKTLKENNFDIKNIGYTNNPIQIGDLSGNRFKITIRDLGRKDISVAEEQARGIETEGVPNYFDSQRFGSATGGEFIASHVIAKDYESAVKQYLTQYTRHEKAAVKEDKRKLLEEWHDIEKLNIKNKTLSRIVEEYKKTRSWLAAYNAIPNNLRNMFISSYQSYIWNECIKQIIKDTIDPNRIFKIKYNVGELLLYNDVKKQQLNRLPPKFPMISPDSKLKDDEKRMIDKVLAKKGAGIEELDIKKNTGNEFKRQMRSTITYPTGFIMSSPKIDELNDQGRRNKFKMTLEFTLPKGSYATIITKRMFLQ